MNVGSYGLTEPRLWLVIEIPTPTWDDCCTTSERKSRTHTYDDVVDLLIELALERENDSHMERFSRDTWVEVPPLPLNVAKEKGPENPNNASKGGGKGGGNLGAMGEIKPETGAPPRFYCKPVNDKGGPDETHRWGYFLRTKPSNEDYFFERRKFLNCSNAFGVAVLLHKL